MAKAQYTHDVVATIGEYTDRQTGEKKKQYLTVGKAFTDDSGRISIKVAALPVGPDWSGWLSLYPAESRPAHNRPQERQPARPAPAQEAARDQVMIEDEIPF